MAENKYQYSYQYPHPAVTTDCVVFGYDVAPEDRESKKKNKRMALQVLLIERGGEPYKGCWVHMREELSIQHYRMTDSYLQRVKVKNHSDT